MKNTLTFTIVFALLFGSTLGCKNNVLSKFKQSKCAVDLPKLNSAEEYAKRGFNEINESNHECAFDDCQKALDLDGKNTDALTCRGYIYMKREEFSLAESDYNEALRLEPDNPLVLYQRSHLYRETKQFGKALTDMNKTIELIPADHHYERRARIYVELNDFENAVKDYTEAIRQKPDYYIYYKYRAEAYRQLGKTDLAAADERKYEELRAAEDNQNGNAPGEISGAVVNDLAVSLPEPVYPPAARAVKAGGEVKVQIEVDAKGNVTSAKAILGHPLLRASAESAARQAKFKPAAMTGILVFNFTAQ